MRIVDLFCGGGGLSYGMAQAGHRIVAAYDCWTPALDFYNRNIHDHHAYRLDLSNVAESIVEIRRWNPDVIIGGPPCQDFSSAGKRDENGGRACLTTAYAKIVTSIRPRLFVMENVDRAIKTRTYRSALRMFKEAGYDLAVAVLDASLCGAPQIRKRIVAVGVLGVSASPIIDLYKANQAHSQMTLREYFGDGLGLNYYYRHPRSYARRGVFSVDEPSPTVRGVNRPIPNGYPGHDGDAAPITTPGLRPLTTRERSRIQTFPADWDLFGKKSDVEQIIGNAVPCALGTFVGRALASFNTLPHERVTVSADSVEVFVQHAERCDDMQTVVLEQSQDSDDCGTCEKSYKYCEPYPSQMLLAVERRRAKLSAKVAKRGFAGTRLAMKRTA